MVTQHYIWYKVKKYINTTIDVTLNPAKDLKFA